MHAAPEITHPEKPCGIETALVVVRMHVSRELLRSAREDLAVGPLRERSVARGIDDPHLCGRNDLAVGIGPHVGLRTAADADRGGGHLGGAVSTEEQTTR